MPHSGQREIENSSNEFRELPVGFTAQFPIGLSLISGDKNDEFFAVNSPEYSQIEELQESRHELSELLRDYFRTIDDSVADPEKTAILYEKLGSFFGEDDTNYRIVLYLPFEILPTMDASTNSPTFESARKKFHASYVEAWIRLLFDSESRASFVDGDVLEVGMEDPIRIRKAAHFIPDLLARKILTVEECIHFLNHSKEEELSRSLFEGLMAAHDNALVGLHEWDMILEEADKKGVLRIQESIPVAHMEKINFSATEMAQPWREIIHSVVETVHTKADAIDSEVTLAGISNERTRWEKKARKETLYSQAAQKSADIFSFTSISPDQVSQVLVDWSEDEILLFIQAIDIHFSRLKLKDTDAVHNQASMWKLVFLKIWETTRFPRVRDSLIHLISSLKRNEISDDLYASEFGIRIPDLSAPFPADFEKLIRDDLAFLIDAAKQIEDDLYLSTQLEPYLLAFGSRVKGYGASSTDFDVAIFFKPEARFEDREHILNVLKEKLPSLHKIDKIIEYWQADSGATVTFRTPETDIPTLVGIQEVQFILDGVLIGDEVAIDSLQKNIVSQLTNLDFLGEDKSDFRSYFLGEIERDILQYRLLHVGYERFYPTIQREHFSTPNLIDRTSTFWDPGYRQIATQLFVSRVFLPDLSRDSTPVPDMS